MNKAQNIDIDSKAMIAIAQMLATSKEARSTQTFVVIPMIIVMIVTTVAILVGAFNVYGGISSRIDEVNTRITNLANDVVKVNYQITDLDKKITANQYAIKENRGLLVQILEKLDR